MTEQHFPILPAQEAPVLWWWPDGVAVADAPSMPTTEEGVPWIRPFMAERGGSASSAQDDRWRHAQLKATLEEALARRRPLVHAGGDGGPLFQWALLRLATRLGYRHRVLHWADRLRALRAVAHRLGWPDQERRLPVLLRADAAIQQRLAYVCQLMQAGGHDWQAVSLAAPPDALLFSGLPAPWGEAMSRALQAASAPLADAAEAQLNRETAWRTDLQQRPCFLRPKASEPEGRDPRVKLARFDGLPPWLEKGSRLNPGGVVLFDSPAPARLSLAQDGVTHALDWPCPSPGVAAKWPDLPAAKAARFRAAPLQADDRRPARLVVQPADGADIPALDLRFQPHPRPQVLGIFLSRWSIGYQPIPKVACTSLKEALFRLVMQAPFSPNLGGGASHIHAYFDQREQDVTQAAWRFLVVRDPIQRFLSGYSNRVLHHRELSRDYVARLSDSLGLQPDEFPCDPDLDTFIANFDFYCRVPTIHHHFRPISEFVAPLEAFDRVYAFEELSTLATDLSQRTGQPFTMPHSQRGGPKLTVGQIGPASMKKLIDIYAQDYAMLARYYAPPAASAAGQ